MNENEVDALSSSKSSSEFDALQKIIEALTPLSKEVRRRIFEAAATFLQIESHVRPEQIKHISSTAPNSINTSVASYSENTSMSPKDFLVEKRPKTDVERIACLAYYLTHYRETPYFKTLDLSMLNTEAAQPKFANTAYATNNAAKMGYLVPASKGQRQLSAFGEQFVRALPDREAAKETVSAFRRRPRIKKAKVTNEIINTSSREEAE